MAAAVFPVQERSLGHADAFGELALREAGLRPDLGDIDHRNLDHVDPRAGVLAARKGDRFVEALDQLIVKLAHRCSP